ncbi:MAG TPA: hypothetical protein PK103_05890 [Elusimicrobiales bacterium]|nr:hypothetical protein [Elusimicrobiales bacterium]HOL62879.1 hypothetical protein [Elusimicrobiales bacterium]HPO94993.1 hypothetical protein [Elusimicrobiales bacterium]
MKKIIAFFMFSMSVLSFNAIADGEVSSKSVNLTGYLNLSGSVYVPNQNSYASGYVGGWLSLKDSTGKYYTNNTYINVNVNFYVNGSYVYVTVYPNQYLSVYKEGKYVGSVYINQSVSLSGWVSGNYVNLNGSSYISQFVYLSDED